MLQALACIALSWHGPTLRAQPVRLRSSVVALAVNDKGGFGQAPKPKAKAPRPEPAAAAAQFATPETPRTPRGEAGVEDVLARAGLRPQPSSQALRDAAFKEPTLPSAVPPPLPPPGPLAGVPMEIQNQMEQVFVTLCGLALTFFILCGFATIEDAYLTVTKSEPPAFLTTILPFMSKAFTPSLGIVLLCSITLGLFKQAQFADPSTGLSYVEKDE